GDPAGIVDFDRWRVRQVRPAYIAKVLTRFFYACRCPDHQRLPSGAVVVADDAIDVPVGFGGDVVEFFVETAGRDEVTAHVAVGEGGGLGVEILHRPRNGRWVLRERRDESLRQTAQTIIYGDRRRRRPC